MGALQTDENGNIVRNTDGSLKATTGTALSNAFASLGALDMERGKQFMVAGTSMTMDMGRGGEVRITATSVDKLSRGDEQDYKISGSMGDVAAAALSAGGALLVADRAVKTFSPSKRGIFERVYGKTRGLGSGKSIDETMDKAGNGNHAQNNTHPNENIHNKTTGHNNTPSSDSNIHNYNTIDEVTQAKEKLHTMEPEAAAKKAVKQSLTEAGRQYPKNSPQRTEIAQMQQDLRNGRPVDAQRFNES